MKLLEDSLSNDNAFLMGVVSFCRIIICSQFFPNGGGKRTGSNDSKFQIISFIEW